MSRVFHALSRSGGSTPAGQTPLQVRTGRVAPPVALACFASVGAGLIHLAVVREHLAEWWLYAAFFLLTGLLQCGWAVASLARGRPLLARATAAANFAVVVLWAMTRTTGIPVGPDRWTAEPVGYADIAAGLLELTIAGALILQHHNRFGLRVRAGYLAQLAAAALAVAAVTTPALATTGAGEHAHHHAAASLHQRLS